MDYYLQIFTVQNTCQIIHFNNNKIFIDYYVENNV